MKFKRMYIEGAYSFPILDFDFTKQSGGVTIILGKNLDQQTNNGAGKSTILKSLFLLLYGKDLNGATIDDAISWNSIAGFSGYLEFEDRGSNFKITRFRKAVGREGGVKLFDGTPVSGSGLEFLMDGMPLNGDTSSQTQSIIENKVRISQKLFLSSVLMAQNSRDNFLLANDTEKKELLSELLDLMEYAKAFDNIKKEISLIETKISTLELKIENLTDILLNNKSKLKQFDFDESKWDDENKNQIILMKKELSLEKEKQTKLKDQLNKASDASIALNLKSEIESLTKKIENLDTKLSKETKADLAKVELSGKIQEASVHIKNILDQITKNNEEITELEKSLDEKIVLINIEDLTKRELDISSKLNKDFKNPDIISSELSSISSSIKDKTSLKQAKENELDLTLKDSKCPTCKKNFEKGDIHFDEITEKYTTEIHVLTKEVLSLVEEKNKLENEFKVSNKIKEENDKLEIELKEISQKIQEKTILNEKNKVLLNQQKYNKERIEKNIKENNDLEIKKSKIDDFVKSKQDKLKVIEELIKSLDPLKKEKENLSKTLNEKNILFKDYEKTLSIQENLKEQEKDLNQRIISISSKIEEYTKKTNPYKKFKEDINKDIQEQEKNLNELQKESDDVQEEMKYLQFWKKGFAPTGIRSFITDDIMDILNMKTQENLNDLFDGALTVLFEPETSGKKGVSSNKISTKFFLNGYEAKKENLSGGELQRAILAVDLALTEIAESRSGITLNLKFLDEPFNGIDASGQLKSLTLFSRLAKNKDGFYIISHEEKFQNLCQNAIYILKKNNISQFVDKESFDSISFTDEEADLFYMKQEAAVQNKPGRGRPKKIKKISSLKDNDE